MITRYLFLLLIPLWFAFTVFAAEEDEKKDQAESQQKTTTSTKAVVSKRGQVKPLEEFIPSEEVSADKPVAFPNDI